MWTLRKFCLLSTEWCPERHELLALPLHNLLEHPGHHPQTLRVQLTSEEDPFFLHTLEVSEEDFSTLKVEQGILVDFGTFPGKLIELLDACIDSRNQDPARYVVDGEARRPMALCLSWPLEHPPRGDRPAARPGPPQVYLCAVPAWR